MGRVAANHADIKFAFVVAELRINTECQAYTMGVVFRNGLSCT